MPFKSSNNIQYGRRVVAVLNLNFLNFCTLLPRKKIKRKKNPKVKFAQPFTASLDGHDSSTILYPRQL